MALGSLFVLFVSMSLLAILGIVLLFVIKKEAVSDKLLLVLTFYSLIIAFLGASAEPTNFVLQQLLHWGIGFVAVIGAVYRFMTRSQSMSSKIIVSGSLLAGILYTFLF